MKARSAVTALLIAAVCATCLTACGGSHAQKVSDSSFVNSCAAALAKAGTVKTHRAEVCKCVQQKLEAQGFGDRSSADTSFATAARIAGQQCAIAASDKISDPSFVRDCEARSVNDAKLAAHQDEVCKCIQDKLEAQGFGNRATADTSFANEARAAGAACARKVLTRK